MSSIDNQIYLFDAHKAKFLLLNIEEMLNRNQNTGLPVAFFYFSMLQKSLGLALIKELMAAILATLQKLFSFIQAVCITKCGSKIYPYPIMDNLKFPGGGSLLCSFWSPDPPYWRGPRSILD